MGTTRPTLIRALLCALVSLAVSVACAGTAWAEGGTSVAGATAITPGVQEFGNLLNGQVTDTICQPLYTEWWNLPVTTGDQVTFDFEAQLDGTELNVYPIGTTDYTYLDTNPLLTQVLNINLKAQATFTAARSGVVPISFDNNQYGFDNCPQSGGGPFDFTTSVAHAVTLGLLPVEATLRATALVGVHNPDGVPLSNPALVVSVEVQASGLPWTTVGTAAAVNGAATASYSLPSTLLGKTVTFRATASGPGYVSATSTTQRVKLTGTGAPKHSPVKPACVVPRMTGKTLGAAKSALRRAHCTLGKVQHKSRRGHRGRVIAQTPKAQTHRPSGTKVGVTLGR